MPLADKRKREQLQGALDETTDILDMMPPLFKDWLEVYHDESGQRYSNAMGMGDLIHSEVREDLKEMGYMDFERVRIMRVLKKIDSIMRDHGNSKTAPDGKITVPALPTNQNKRAGET